MRTYRSFERAVGCSTAMAVVLTLSSPRIAWCEPPIAPVPISQGRSDRVDEPGEPLPDLSDEELDARAQFLERRLRRDVKLLALWQVGYSVVYGGGFLYQAGNAVTAGSTAERADFVVGTVKSFVGLVTRLAQPPRALVGVRPLLALPNTTRLDRVNRLLAAEALLRADARESDRRYHWLPHTLNALLNLAGGLIVWLGYHDLSRAAESTGIGFAVGELQIWTRPWQGKRAWAEYRRAYGATATSMAGIPERTSRAPTRTGGVKLSATSLELTF
jgi:hypothetical protein